MAPRRPSEVAEKLASSSVWSLVEVELEERTAKPPVEPPVWVRLDHSPVALPFQPHLRFDLAEGRAVCTGILLLADEPIPASAIREVPVGLLVSMALGSAQLFAERLEVPEVPPRPPGRRAYGPGHWQDVALVYREALKERPSAPIRRTAELLRRPYPTVRRWIGRVREMGLVEKEEEL